MMPRTSKRTLNRGSQIVRHRGGEHMVNDVKKTTCRDDCGGHGGQTTSEKDHTQSHKTFLRGNFIHGRINLIERHER